MIDELAIGSLPAGQPMARARVRGRVIGGASSTTAPLVVADESGSLSVYPAPAQPAPALGALVDASGRFDGKALRDAQLTVASEPSRPFGGGDSDWAWAQPDRLVALRIRHAILRLVRQFFDESGFSEVETPNLTRSPGLELHLDAMQVDAGEQSPRYLHTSPEYHMKRLLSAGMSRIYQLCKVYRRAELGGLHLPEFTMLEWYRGFAGCEEMIADTEHLLYFVVGSVRGGDPTLPPRGDRKGEIDLTPPWPRLTVEQAFAEHADRSLTEALADPELFFRVLSEQVEPRLGRERPLVLTRYPAALASLARLCPDDPASAERFEVYVDGVELCNGFSELTDAAEQRRRLEADARARAAQGRPQYPIDERFLGALEDGIPPSGGNALGVDRLVMLALGADRVDEVVAFPAERV